MKTFGIFTILLSLLSGPAFPADGLPAATRKLDSPSPADTPGEPDSALPALPPFVRPISPAPSPVSPKTVEPGVDWVGLSRASLRFLAIQHSFRLLTEPGTRAGLKGPFLRNYGRAVSNLHGFADGDEFYVNYVGHPMEGAVAGFLWIQNDPAYSHAEFGSSRAYWKGRLRAAAFAWVFSTQFEIGPVSEASIGAIQATAPQQGFADHVITPSIGMGWMIGEDFVDRYVIKRIEGSMPNPYLRALLRSGLNPSRTFANVLQGRVPWKRETRSGVKTYVASADIERALNRQGVPDQRPDRRDSVIAPPFEVAFTFQAQRFNDDRKNLSCLGGGATAGLRLASSWQLIADVGGCNIMGLDKNLSGDSLTYMAGPRFVSRIRGPWSAYVQFLAGGNKVTEERMHPELKQLLQKAAIRENKTPPVHDDYTEATESHGFVVAPGAGLSYNLSPALTLRVADLSYRHAWTSPLWGREYNSGIQWSSGLVLRMGTW